MDAAADRLAAALRTDDLFLQERACYNRGNALVGQTAAQRQQNKLDEAQKSLTEALGMYERAILLGPNDEAAKVNYELALRLQQELEQQKQQQQQQEKQPQEQQPSKDHKDKSKPEQPQNQQPNQQPQQQQPENSQTRHDQQRAEQQTANGQEKKADEMTPEEARQLLDALRQEEQAVRERVQLPVNTGQNQPVEKDW